MAFQSQLDQISALLFSHGLRERKFSVDNVVIPDRQLEYLPLQASELRLLRISHNAYSNEMEFTLQHYRCDSYFRCTKQYIALSYCWGDADDTVPIVVNNSRLAITRPLQAALQELNRRKYDYLWIDAICINQSDKDERGNQILKMRDIYRNAHETVVWLGIDSIHTEEAFSICNTLATGVPQDQFTMRVKQLSSTHPERLEDLSGWKAVAALTALPYWSRTWVIQEVVISRTTIILWGPHVIDLETIQTSVEVLRKYSPTIWHYFSGFDHMSGILGLRTLMLGGELTAAGERMRPAPNDDLLGVLSLSCLSRASEPRDKVFGVLGLAIDGLSTIPDPNYDEPIEALVRKVTIKKLTEVSLRPEQVVDIICLDNGKVPRRKNFPSWVVDWTSLWEVHDGNIWSSRFIRFLSLPDLTRYKACAQSPASVQVSPDELTLTCHGYKFDEIRSLSEVDLRGFSLEDAGHRSLTLSTSHPNLSISQNVYGSEPDLYKAIWLSAIHHPAKDSDGQITDTPIRSFQNLFSEDIRQPWWVDQTWMEVIKASGDFEFYGRRLKEWFAPSREIPSSLANINGPDELSRVNPAQDETLFWDSIQIGRLGRRMMETEKGYVGTAHSQAHVGDTIVLLQGASVPIILRPCEDGYRVIGEAYVHGIMEGEFWWEAHEKLTMQAFDLK